MDPLPSRCCNCICNDAVQRKIKCVLLSISARFHNNILCYELMIIFVPEGNSSVLVRFLEACRSIASSFDTLSVN